jgi:hypothetical protein
MRITIDLPASDPAGRVLQAFLVRLRPRHRGPWARRLLMVGFRAMLSRRRRIPPARRARPVTSPAPTLAPPAPAPTRPVDPVDDAAARLAHRFHIPIITGGRRYDTDSDSIRG